MLVSVGPWAFLGRMRLRCDSEFGDFLARAREWQFRRVGQLEGSPDAKRALCLRQLYFTLKRSDAGAQVQDVLDASQHK